jgi:putative membrane protein
MGETRTIMAADRTLMAWIRTSLSMLSFGFTIYKFLDAMIERRPARPLQQPAAGRHVPRRHGHRGAWSWEPLSYWTTLRDLERIEEFRIGRPALAMALIHVGRRRRPLHQHRNASGLNRIRSRYRAASNGSPEKIIVRGRPATGLAKTIRSGDHSSLPTRQTPSASGHHRRRAAEPQSTTARSTIWPTPHQGLSLQ